MNDIFTLICIWIAIFISGMQINKLETRIDVLEKQVQILEQKK